MISKAMRGAYPPLEGVAAGRGRTSGEQNPSYTPFTVCPQHLHQEKFKRNNQRKRIKPAQKNGCSYLSRMAF